MTSNSGSRHDISAMADEIRNSDLSDADKRARAKQVAEELAAIYRGFSKAIFIAEATRRSED